MLVIPAFSPFPTMFWKGSLKVGIVRQKVKAVRSALSFNGDDVTFIFQTSIIDINIINPRPSVRID